VKTDVTAPGGTDYVTTRDFYYYVAYQKDGFGTWSPAVTTPGTLNYHLGDVSNGTTAGVGNNHVYTEDISLLGTHYGLAGGALAAYAYLDVGPTTNRWIDGRPTTDGKVSFEDLVMFALNYAGVSAPTAPLADRPAGVPDELTLEAPDRAAVGATVTARLTMHGSGALIALSTQLAWDPAVVEPMNPVAGAWLTQQSGVAFSAVPGNVDAAVLQSPGMTGEGELATVAFKVLSAGDPRVRIASLDGRDARNQKVAVTSSLRPLTPMVPLVTRLAPAKPNPFRQATTVVFSLAERGTADLLLYSVDGRKVRTLTQGVREPGEYTLVWDGCDDDGNAMAAGVYYAHLTTAQGRFTRTLTYLR
jgi:hypothetical protein